MVTPHGRGLIPVRTIRSALKPVPGPDLGLVREKGITSKRALEILRPHPNLGGRSPNRLRIYLRFDGKVIACMPSPLVTENRNSKCFFSSRGEAAMPGI